MDGCSATHVRTPSEEVLQWGPIFCANSRAPWLNCARPETLEAKFGTVTGEARDETPREFRGGEHERDLHPEEGAEGHHVGWRHLTPTTTMAKVFASNVRKIYCQHPLRKVTPS